MNFLDPKVLMVMLDALTEEHVQLLAYDLSRSTDAIPIDKAVVLAEKAVSRLFERALEEAGYN